jgi:hexosaminidase
MKKIFILSSILIVASLLSCQKKVMPDMTVALIPQPLELTEGQGAFEITSSTIISVENAEQEKIAAAFFAPFERVEGWTPEVKINADAADIIFSTDATSAPEGYTLDVTQEKISITASGNAGFFYALQTLKQLLPTEFLLEKRNRKIVWAVPAVSIKDEPAFGWRGYMLDVSRHFFSKEDVFKVLDFMAELKLNRFHWHLADDQGWRVEIKKYPKLTEVGAWRVDHNTADETISNWWGRPVQQPGEKATYGGFYTQDEIREIVAYAKARFIEVIPELDMPGHSQAIVAAYPEIGCLNAAPFVATGGVYKNNTCNPGKEVTFEFAENMLNEIMDLFPFDYVHIGGDECNKEQWKIDPHAQQRIKDEGLKDEHELQSYFIHRIEKIINARGKNMIGWDEILEGGLAPNATVMSWRGEKGGIASAKAGHDVIMTPNSYCYIDLKQGPDDLEPNLGYSRLLLSTAYNYRVFPESLSDEETKHILGIQANLWTESISDWSKLTYMTFPRLYAVAENGWTPESRQNWDNFTTRLRPHLQKLEAEKVRYATSAFNVNIEQKSVNHEMSITMSTEVNGLDIYYTLDGSEPTQKSNQYNKPFVLMKSATVKAIAFQNSERVSKTSELTFPLHAAKNATAVYHTPYMPNKSAGGDAALIDNNYARFTITDNTWQGFMGDMEVDLVWLKPQKISAVQLTFLRMTISGVYPPEGVEIFGSKDGESFSKIGEVHQVKISHTQGRNKIHSKIELEPDDWKALKIKAKSVSPIPDGHHRAGGQSKIYVDEIVVM